MRINVQNMVTRLSRIPFVRQAIADKADLSPFKEPPTLRVIAGVGAIGFSYVIGWPLIAGLGALSIHLARPAIVLIGGPVAYGLSHLVFILGMYLAGAEYSMVFLRWLTRVGMLKLMALTRTSLPNELPPPSNPV
ncbi:hypothetical protein DSCO28_21830 [Desulfosarcina ovata subsp. sediminis]|uniref:Uncharacterized protein n=1 Tax=Desulfosarcina ovata subsp. sediminis TaxID=885957 RepID=A0A5K7ZN13_9BACT|nr:hypothetical protein [Desulfosarcina ovata]BBO81617.1 hypothetical protein DSCO28_21830 [Desulfosarcina ovata subsp. sediminis]